MAHSAVMMLVVVLMALGFCHGAVDSHDRSLSSTTGARSAKAAAAVEERDLYVDPTAKPTSTAGWNVVLTIICKGKFTTVQTIKLRQALLALGFPTNPQSMMFGGNAATTNWRSITSFVVNIPAATSSSSAKAAVAKITPKALNNLAKLKAAMAVLQVLKSEYKA